MLKNRKIIYKNFNENNPESVFISLGEGKQIHMELSPADQRARRVRSFVCASAAHGDQQIGWWDLWKGSALGVEPNRPRVRTNKKLVENKFEHLLIRTLLRSTFRHASPQYQ